MRALIAGRRGLVIAVLAAAGFAVGATAYWSGIGQGSAEAKLGDPQTLVLTAGTATAQLFPGGEASVSVVASNPNPYIVHFGSLALDASVGSGGFEVDMGHSACDVAVLAFEAQDNGGAGWSVPPKTGVSNGELPINMAASLTMGQHAANACQGAVFTVHLEASA